MMALLILGLILWVGAHYFRRFMPDSAQLWADGAKASSPSPS